MKWVLLHPERDGNWKYKKPTPETAAAFFLKKEKIVTICVPVKFYGTYTCLQEMASVGTKHNSFTLLFMAITSIVINPFIINCSVHNNVIKRHKKLHTDLFDSGHDIICVTGCGPNPTASLSPIPPLLSKMTPRASGMAQVYGFQNEEYTDHDSTENVFL